MTGIVVSELDRHVAIAGALHDARRPRQAETLLHWVLAWNPAHLPALARLAEIAIERHDHTAALTFATAALHQEPNFAPAWCHFAQALWLAGRIAEAVEPARRAVEIQPTNPAFRITLGQILAVLGRAWEAERSVGPLLEQVWQDKVMRARALGVVAEACAARGAFEAANQALERAVAQAPGYDPLRLAHGLSLLRLGRLSEGWAAYRRRERIGFFFPAGGSGMPGERWSGQKLTGKTILLKDEQGYGDAIQFFRFIPRLHRAGAERIVLATFSQLMPLFRASTGLAEVVDAPDPAFRPDFHCMTGDLPGGFATTLHSIPDEIPYLRPPAARRAGTGSVGLVWSGDPRHPKDHARSIAAERFLRLADGSSRRFVSLQTVVRPADLPALVNRPAIARVGERLRDFGETAAVVASLDLVITVDTAIAHLAGALGKPVWVLLPLDCDWRWLIGRTDSPWYPTMRLFRVGLDGWDPVIELVKRELAAKPA